MIIEPKTNINVIIEPKTNIKVKAALESNNVDEIRSLFEESKNTSMYVCYEKTETILSGKAIFGGKDLTIEDRHKAYVLRNLCKNPHTPKDTLESLIQIGYWLMYKESFCSDELKTQIAGLWNDPNNRLGVYITPPNFRKQ